MSSGLAAGFLASLDRVPNRPALSIDGRELSYADLSARAAGLADALGEDAAGSAPLTALLAARSVAAYAGLLAILFRGQGYVPLNPKFPVMRLAYILQHSRCQRLIVDDNAELILEALLEIAEHPLTVVMADRTNVETLATRYPGHTFWPGRATSEVSPISPSEDAIAYLLYTSGSTGRPKGVMVSHTNVEHFLNVITDRYKLAKTDRFSQMFDLNFDLSVFDIFAAWKVGGCICCPSEGDLMLPTEYIRREKLSVWFSVPSAAALMMRLRQLEPDAFPNLRVSLFCGEALPAASAAAWARAAPGSIVENLYGPTEVTLACTAYRCTGELPKTGIVPIGTALDGLAAKVVDTSLTEIAPGAEGELLMSGPQVALGYWQDEEKTKAAFVTDPVSGVRSYRTGDLVRQPEVAGAPILYLGRIDHQIKLHGHRIELGEIEAVLREATGAAQVVVVGWPVTDDGIAGLAAFIECDTVNTPHILASLRTHLPAYMIPKTLRAIPELPLTSNGKVDRPALITFLSDTSKTFGAS